MQGAKTTQIMLSCERRVHLHNSASFKTIFEQIQTNLKTCAKVDSKMVDFLFIKS